MTRKAASLNKIKNFWYSEPRNNLLKEQQGIEFKDLIDAILNNKIVAILTPLNTKKYPKQQVFIVDLKQHMYFVPYLEHRSGFLLITALRSLKWAKYIQTAMAGGQHEHG